MTEFLLATKFIIPPEREGLFFRERLASALDVLLTPGKRLGVLSAPPGYGKTVLASMWAGRVRASGQARVGWLALDDEDNDPVRFWGHFIAALQESVPGLAHLSLPSPQAPQPPSLSIVLGEVINEIHANGQPLLLVLDDLHLVRSPDIRVGLEYFLERMPAELRLLVLTRSDPALSLARLRVRGALVELRMADLGFTPAETELFFSGLASPLEPDQLTVLHTRTEGWPAGLQLAALSLQARGERKTFLDAFSGEQGYILDYLTEEVLSRVSEAEKRFLLETSILDQLCGPLCAAVTERAESQQWLEEAARSNLFVIPMDGSRRWYRYHHLFAELLRAQLERLMPGMTPGLHRRASAWFEAQRLPEPAARHALAGQDWERLARLVETYGEGVLMRGEMRLLRSWIKNLPPEIVNDRPRLSVLKAWLALLSGDPPAVQESLARVEALRGAGAQPLAAEEWRTIAGHVAAIRCYASVMRGDLAAANDYAGQALELLPESERGIRALAAFSMGGARVSRQDAQGAIAGFEEAARLAEAAGNIHLAIPALGALGGVLFQTGDLEAAATAYERAENLAVRFGGEKSPLLGRVYSGWSNLCYERNQLSDAERYGGEGLALAERWGNQDVIAGCFAAFIQALVGLGKLAEAQTALTRFKRFAKDQKLGKATAYLLEVAQVRVELARPGALSPAATQFAEQCEDLREWADAPRFEFAVKIFLRGDQPEKAAWAARKLLAWSEPLGWNGQRVGVLAHAAVVAYETGEDADAVKLLNDAAELARQTGFIRSVLDAGDAIPRLLRALARARRAEGQDAGAVERLLAACPARAVEEEELTLPSAVDALTERELEVLRLAAEGLSNVDIAHKLVIARGTVKRHINHIFAKLEATTRTQAVAKARQRGLLKE